MNLSSEALLPAYRACLDEAFSQSPQLIKRWYVRLSVILHERSARSTVATEKRQFEADLSALKNNQLAIENGFALELTKAISNDTRPIAERNNDRNARSLSSLRFDQLELMGDAQVQETLDDARLQQGLLMPFDAGLLELSARLSTAQGLKVVKADKNPLRPEVFSQALLSLLQQIPVGSATRSRWLAVGAQPMSEELQALYARLNQLLENENIAPAAYVVVSSTTEKVRLAAASVIRIDGDREQLVQKPFKNDSQRLSGRTDKDSELKAFQAVKASEGINRKQLLTLDHLHHLVAGDYDDSFKDRSFVPAFDSKETDRRDFSETVPAAMDVLAELAPHGQLTTFAENALPVSSLEVSLMREQLKAGAKSLGQALAIEVVGLMIEQLTSDTRLLLQVRQLIANAEPAFLRLAVTDPRFFSNKNHPARQLLEVMTTTSLAYASEEAVGFAEFMQHLREMAAGLTEELAGDAEHFAKLLQEFENKRASYTQKISESQVRAVQALLQAEQRNLLAEKIAAEIRVRPDFVSVNRIINAFLTGPWAQVMARERLQVEHGSIGSLKTVFSLTLGDILWSLDGSQTLRHRERLMKIIPEMLNSMREGLRSIDYPFEQAKAFFDELMLTHERILRPGSAYTRKTGFELEEDFDNDEIMRDKRINSHLWLAPSEAHDSGFLQAREADEKTDFEATVPSSHIQPGEGESLETALQKGIDLQRGAWVELLYGIGWIRAQLTWISPYNTLFMFTSQGGRSHSMTAHMLQALLLNGKVKIVSDHGVLDGALDKVARTAGRNSVDKLIDS